MKKITCIKTLIISILIINSSFAQEATWTQKADFLGISISSNASFAIGDIGYIGSGATQTGNVVEFWAYDSVNDVWSQKADVGGNARSRAIGFHIGDRGYIGMGVVSGTTSSDDLWEYDPNLNNWEQRATYPGEGNIGATAFTIGNKAYLATGSSSGIIGNETKAFWVYDQANDTWTQKAEFAGAPRERAVGFSIGSNGYIGTGFYYDGVAPINYNDIWEYNVANDTWVEMQAMPTDERSSAQGFALGNMGYIGLGYPARTDFWQFDPTTNSWLEMTEFEGEGRIGATSFAIGNKGYVGLGSIYKNGQVNPFHDFWEFDDGIVGIDQTKLNNSIALYPNPAQDFIALNMEKEEAFVAIIYDYNGKKQLVIDNKRSIDISTLSKGAYILKISINDQEVTKKFLKF